MKRPVRWLLIAAGAVLVLVVLLLIFKDALLTVWVRHRLATVTGMKTELRRAHWGLAPTVVSLEGLRLHNPPEFGGGIFLDLPELRVEPAVDALVNQRLRLTRVRVNFAELNIVENADGTRNLDRFHPPPALRKKPRTTTTDTTPPSQPPAAPATRPGPEREPAPPSAPSPPPETTPPGSPSAPSAPHAPPAPPPSSQPTPAKLEFEVIETLELTLGRVRFISHQDPRRSRELVMDIQGLELHDVRSASDLSAVLLAVSLKNSLGLLAGDWRAPFRWWRDLARPRTLREPSRAPAGAGRQP